MLDPVDDISAVKSVAHQIQQVLAEPFLLSGHEIKISASIGITLSNVSQGNIEALLRDADTAMYQAKNQGKGRYAIFDSSMHEQVVNRLRLENDLHRLVQGLDSETADELQLYYQPIIELETGIIKGFEALARWHHPIHGVIPPLDFIPMAEETKLIIPMGNWILRQACQQMVAWQQQFSEMRSLQVSINLSGIQIFHPNLVSQIRSILDETELDAACLKIELTETILIEHETAAASILQGLRSLGISIALDDFGTGYSSLSYLHQLPINTVKVDRSFVEGIAQDRDKQALVKSIIKLAHSLDMEVVAEGIETHQQAKTLKALISNYGQGYLFSHPVPAQNIPELMQSSLRFSGLSPATSRS